MTVVAGNIVANTAGRLFTALLSFGLLPRYVSCLGAESYGLVGFYTTLSTVFILLELGTSTTLTREIATQSLRTDGAARIRNLVRTLELTIAVVALSAGLMIAVASPWIAGQWLNRAQISSDAAQRALLLMGFAIALQFPDRLYTAGLIGIQRQVLMNALSSAIALMRGVITLAVLVGVSSTIEAYFLAQIATGLLGVVAFRIALWRTLPTSPGRAIFRFEVLRTLWKYSAGISGITFLAILLTQTDKLLLSKLLSLEQFACYSLAGVAAGSLNCIVGPVFTATFPRITQLAGAGDQAGLNRVYHLSCQTMSVAIIPPALVMAFFADDFLQLWLRDPEIVRQTKSVLPILAIGTMLNAFMNVPYGLQLAHGWTRLALVTNAVAVVTLVPLTVLLAVRYGPVGGASAWLILNAGYVLVSAHVMHRRLLRGEKWMWYFQDVGVPLAATTLTVACVHRWTLGVSVFETARFIPMIIAAAAGWVAALMCARQLRSECAIRVIAPLVKHAKSKATSYSISRV